MSAPGGSIASKKRPSNGPHGGGEVRGDGPGNRPDDDDWGCVHTTMMEQIETDSATAPTHHHTSVHTQASPNAGGLTAKRARASGVGTEADHTDQVR